MHATADTTVVIYLPSLGAARDAQRWAASTLYRMTCGKVTSNFMFFSPLLVGDLPCSSLMPTSALAKTLKS
jgi:hypothetical protein